MNKFRVNLHSALFDIETWWDSTDVKEKTESVQWNNSVEYKPQGVSSTIQEAEKNSKAQDEKDLKKLEDEMWIWDTPEIWFDDINMIKNFDYNGLFDPENLKDLKFKDWIEKKDEKWTYIEINWKKLYHSDYSNWRDGIYYNILKAEDGEPLFIVESPINGNWNTTKDHLIIVPRSIAGRRSLDVDLPE